MYKNTGMLLYQCVFLSFISENYTRFEIKFMKNVSIFLYCITFWKKDIFYLIRRNQKNSKC